MPAGQRHVLAVVPAGVKAGDQLAVPTGSEGRELLATVPTGVAPGMMLRLSLSGGAPREAGAESIVVRVPEGGAAGDVLRVEASWGGAFEVRVPAGLGAGALFEAQLARG